jgi:AcrR family transcriptional regulator
MSAAPALHSPGLRERKKERTRRAIAETAFELFASKGFDRVTVAEVARRAEVSEATVFNYFPAKEDLVYGQLETFEDAMIQAVRDRAPDTSILEAFRNFLLRSEGLVQAKDPGSVARLTSMTRIITGSQALLTRERLVHDRYTRALADLIADETSARPGDVGPWVVAHALVGVHRGLIDFVRTQVLAGRTGPHLARRVRTQARHAFAVLEAGLAGYPPSRPKPRR